MATLFTKQKPEGVSSPQWWPGGLIATKARFAVEGPASKVEGTEPDRVAVITVSTASQTVPIAPCIASTEPGQTGLRQTIVYGGIILDLRYRSP